VLLILFALWLLLSHHTIVVTSNGSVGFLKKTSWTFDGCVIGESSWANFSLHHPLLMSRILLGDGFWVIGGPG